MHEEFSGVWSAIIIRIRDLFWLTVSFFGNHCLEPCVWPCHVGYSQGGCSRKPGDRKTADAGFAHLWWAGPQEPSRWQPACSRFQSNISSTLWHSPRGRRPRPKSCSTWGAEGGAMGHTGVGCWTRAGQRRGVGGGRERVGGEPQNSLQGPWKPEWAGVLSPWYLPLTLLYCICFLSPITIYSENEMFLLCFK